MELRGRSVELAALDGLLATARGGGSAGLVLLGEAGVGKTSLLSYAVTTAAGFRVSQVAAAEPESELPFADLHALCRPMLKHLDRLPPPQRDALATVFGTAAPASAPNLFLVGLATLSLFAESAARKPLLCVVDDAQWLDQASAQVLAFVTRRLQAESVVMLFAAREPVREFDGLPARTVEGLDDFDSRALLNTVVRWPLDERVRDAILAEARGNPLALLELPLAGAPGTLAGGFGLPAALPLAGRLEESFLARSRSLSAGARRLLLIAAADPVGDSALMWRAARRLGIARDAADEVRTAGLLTIGATVRFRHTLVRSAVYRAAPDADRRAAHHALARVTDERADPDRRAWHLAQAADAPDESVAAALVASAGRARYRGGLAAAAAFLERAAALTADPALRADRELAAARALHHSGALDRAAATLRRAATRPAGDRRTALIGLLRGQMAFSARRPHTGPEDATALLLDTARRLAPWNAALARETYLDAFASAMLVGRLATGPGLAEVARAALGAPCPQEPARPQDLLLDGLARHFTGDHERDVPLLRRAVSAFRDPRLPPESTIRWGFPVRHAANVLWDDDAWHGLSERHAGVARELGALAVLPVALNQRIAVHLHAGEMRDAAALVDEAREVAEVLGVQRPGYGEAAVAAWCGPAGEASKLIADSTELAEALGEGVGVTWFQYLAAVLHNGSGRFRPALVAAERAVAYTGELGFASWALPELVEAAAALGDRNRAAEAVSRLERIVAPGGSDWGLGVVARSRALIANGNEADRLFREAVDRLGRCRASAMRARTRLVYGEWLRRAERDAEARAELRAAYESLSRMGAEGFAARARDELLVSGEVVRPQDRPMSTELTPQELRIARRARDGRSNAEIGAELFLSARTVEWHIRRILAKLGITSRRGLPGALPEAALEA
ncbi:AAA family ATPase [Paractinoplanes atraurantiacus]|uniref:Regulatory protein, luxR family n=1 Tax=Paractinoplanes atraurantiacus TaxID=1036182 RepID=A0A285JR88_9ACTN|nr:LuxR family transcriptional regulator [Actinoplanes atraurantiacus]SNY62832.1 regulatory protein, luxR family [Actinoplanes atraurantiacus]